MKSVSIVLRVAVENGTAKFVPNRAEDEQARKDFLAYFAAVGKQVFIRAQYSVVTDEYVRFAIRRMHYFAYFGTVVDEGFEPWTKQLPGKTASEKVENLHVQFKKSYLKVRGEKRMFSLRDDRVNKKRAYTYQQAIDYMVWAMDELCAAHKKITEDATGEAWAHEPWRVDA